jgi:hypothetical protein
MKINDLMREVTRSIRLNVWPLTTIASSIGDCRQCPTSRSPIKSVHPIGLNVCIQKSKPLDCTFAIVRKTAHLACIARVKKSGWLNEQISVTGRSANVRRLWM